MMTQGMVMQHPSSQCDGRNATCIRTSNASASDGEEVIEAYMPISMLPKKRKAAAARSRLANVRPARMRGLISVEDQSQAGEIRVQGKRKGDYIEWDIGLVWKRVRKKESGQRGSEEDRVDVCNMQVEKKIEESESLGFHSTSSDYGDASRMEQSLPDLIVPLRITPQDPECGDSESGQTLLQPKGTRFRRFKASHRLRVSDGLGKPVERHVRLFLEANGQRFHDLDGGEKVLVEFALGSASNQESKTYPSGSAGIGHEYWSVPTVIALQQWLDGLGKDVPVDGRLGPETVEELQCVLNEESQPEDKNGNKRGRAKNEAVDVTGELDPVTIMTFRAFLNKYTVVTEENRVHSPSATESLDESNLCNPSHTDLKAHPPSPSLMLKDSYVSLLEGEEQRRANASWLSYLRDQAIASMHIDVEDLEHPDAAEQYGVLLKSLFTAYKEDVLKGGGEDFFDEQGGENTEDYFRLRPLRVFGATKTTISILCRNLINGEEVVAVAYVGSVDATSGLNLQAYKFLRDQQYETFVALIGQSKDSSIYFPKLPRNKFLSGEYSTFSGWPAYYQVPSFELNLQEFQQSSFEALERLTRYLPATLDLEDSDPHTQTAKPSDRKDGLKARKREPAPVEALKLLENQIARFVYYIVQALLNVAHAFMHLENTKTERFVLSTACELNPSQLTAAGKFLDVCFLDLVRKEDFGDIVGEAKVRSGNDSVKIEASMMDAMNVWKRSFPLLFPSSLLRNARNVLLQLREIQNMWNLDKRAMRARAKTDTAQFKASSRDSLSRTPNVSEVLRTLSPLEGLHGCFRKTALWVLDTFEDFDVKKWKSRYPLLSKVALRQNTRVEATLRSRPVWFTEHSLKNDEVTLPEKLQGVVGDVDSYGVWVDFGECFESLVNLKPSQIAMLEPGCAALATV